MTRSLNSIWQPRLVRAAYNLGFVEGHTNYTRFIVLGRSRTGSNFLRGLLNSHPQIVTFGEIFRNYDSLDWAFPGYQQSARAMRKLQSDPVSFVEQDVFGRFPSDVRAVGFKIFYYHAQEHGWAPLWEHLQAQQSLRVIHIKRRNLLRTHLSRARAAQTNNWTDTVGISRPMEPVTLNYEECLADFQRTRAWEEEYDARFAEHPLLEIVYENLSADFDQEMQRVQGFLGVTRRRPEPNTFRQSNEHLRLEIANYDELRARFAGTPWETFFDE
jgi:LPS sulfotransferase NodH